MVFDNLVDSYNGSETARRTVHVGQDLAGMAFSNALLGIVHSLAHKVGVTYDVTHGRCNAIMLPYVIEYNSAVCMDRFADIAKELGIPGSTDKQLTNNLVKAIKELNIALDIPLSYQEAGVDEELFKSTVDTLAEAACGDPCTLFNPRKTEFEDMKKVLTCCFYGDDVSF